MKGWMLRYTENRILSFSLVAFMVVIGPILGADGAIAQTIGTTLSTERTVVGTPPGRSSYRKKGSDPIVRNEIIQTGTESVGQFKFSDNTRLAIGPDAQIELNEAVYAGPQRHRLLKGALRFATDLAQENQILVIDTPVTSIGVRGTIFDVNVEAGGLTRVLLVRGGPVDVCQSGGGGCVPITRVCDAIEVSAAGGFSAVAPVRTFGSAREMGQIFPFASGAERLRRNMRRGAARCGLLSGAILPIRDEERRDGGGEEENDDHSSPYSTPASPTSPTSPGNT